MKLTLSAGGGITGLTKESSVDLNTLDHDTRTAVMRYVNQYKNTSPANFSESWCLEEKEVPVDKKKLNEELKSLYNKMKKNLAYSKR